MTHHDPFGLTVSIIMMVVIVLLAIRLLRREKRSLDTMYSKPRAAEEAAA